MSIWKSFTHALAISAAAATSAAAADWPIERAPPYWGGPMYSPQPISQWESEIGGRYWYSSGRTQLDLLGFHSPMAFFLGSAILICRPILASSLVERNI